jgi:hypothetical protein
MGTSATGQIWLRLPSDTGTVKKGNVQFKYW